MMDNQVDAKTEQVQMIDGVGMLEELLAAMGYRGQSARVAELQAAAERLSLLARKDPPWGWRYLRNVLNRRMDAGKPLWEAMVRLRAVLDGTPAEVASSERVAIQAAGVVRPGALVLASSRPCEGCGMEFVPRTPRQRFHSAGCRVGFYRSRKGDKRGR